jgi:tRNA U34 2-thiouridine synthase MnmA/TrmU
MSGRKEAEFVVREHWRSRNGEERKEQLDKILAAIERGQILTIDGKALVGATAGNMDNTLGQRRALAARGAL